MTSKHTTKACVADRALVGELVPPFLPTHKGANSLCFYLHMRISPGTWRTRLLGANWECIFFFIFKRLLTQMSPLLPHLLLTRTQPPLPSGLPTSTAHRSRVYVLWLILSSPFISSRPAPAPVAVGSTCPRFCFSPVRVT